MKISRWHNFCLVTKVYSSTLLNCIRTILLSYRHSSRADYDKVIRLWAKSLIDIPRIHIHTEGKALLENLPAHKPVILMSNHSSHYDIPILFTALPGSIRMVAKKELRKIPFFGLAMHKAEFVFINRKDRKEALADLDRVKESMLSGIIPWISPEGSRSYNGKLSQPFKKGGFMLALQTGALIIPVGIRGARGVLPSGSTHLEINREVKVLVGEPIDCAKYTVETRKDLMDAVANQICQLADIEKQL